MLRRLSHPLAAALDVLLLHHRPCHPVRDRLAVSPAGIFRPGMVEHFHINMLGGRRQMIAHRLREIVNRFVWHDANVYCSETSIYLRRADPVAVSSSSRTHGKNVVDAAPETWIETKAWVRGEWHLLKKFRRAYLQLPPLSLDGRGGSCRISGLFPLTHEGSGAIQVLK